MTPERNVWVVLQFRDSLDRFEIQGVFGQKQLAEAACHTSRFCVMPFTMNEVIPDEELGEYGEGYYPLAPTVLARESA